MTSRLVALFDCCGSVTAARPEGSGLEFVEFDVESPDDVTIVASSEQGLWASVFVSLAEDNPELGLEGLAPAAEAVGFAHLERVLRAFVSADRSTFELQQAFVRSLVASIDEGAAGKGA